MKAGVSLVSIEGARANLEHDIPDWDFDRVRLAARQLWADVLDGEAIDRAWLTHEELTGGGILKFTMGPRPNKAWASAAEARPPSPN